jgi:hypothetical protein
MVAEPVLPGNVVAACEVEVDPVIEVDPADDEAGPDAPSPTVPKPPVPSPAVPRLDVSAEEAVAVAAVVADEPLLALHDTEVPAATPSELAVLVRATVGLAAAVVPSLSPPPSNVGSVAVLGLAAGHAVEFAGADWPLAFCDVLAPDGSACNGDVACRLGMGGGTLVCATLTPGPTPGPASAIARARKPLIIRVCGFAMHSLRARSGSRDAALMRKESN